MKVLYMNQTSPVFALFVYSFSVIAWEIVQAICVYISISMYINILYQCCFVRNDTAKIYSNSFNTDMRIQLM